MLAEEPEEAGGEEAIAEPGGVELAKPEEAVEAEEAKGEEAEAVEAEEVETYHPVVPELLEAFTAAVDILEGLAERRITPSEAKAVYLEKVRMPVEAVAVEPSKGKQQRKKQARSRKRGSKRGRSS